MLLDVTDVFDEFDELDNYTLDNIKCFLYN